MNSVDIWNDLGNMYLKANAMNAAIDAYQKAIDQGFKNGEIYKNLAGAYVSQGKVIDSIPLYQKSIEFLASEKDKAVVFTCIGDCYRRIGDYDNAIAAFKTAIEIEPGNPELCVGLGEVQRDLEKIFGFDQSETIAETKVGIKSGALQSNTTQKQAPISMDLAALMDSSILNSVIGVEETVMENQLYEPVGMTEVDFSKNNSQLSASIFQNSLSDQKNVAFSIPEEISQPNFSSRIAQNPMMPPAQEAIYNQPVSVVADDFVQTNVRGSSSNSASLKAGVTEKEEKAENENGVKLTLLLTLGIMQYRNGNLEEADSILQSAIHSAQEINNSWFEALAWHANALVKTALGDIKAAIHAYLRAVELAPEQIFPWNNLGSLYCSEGSDDKALDAFKRAIKQNPDDSSCWDGMGDIYTKMGHFDEAISAYQLANVFERKPLGDDAIKTYEKAFDFYKITISSFEHQNYHQNNNVETGAEAIVLTNDVADRTDPGVQENSSEIVDQSQQVSTTRTGEIFAIRNLESPIIEPEDAKLIVGTDVSVDSITDVDEKVDQFIPEIEMATDAADDITISAEITEEEKYHNQAIEHKENLATIENTEMIGHKGVVVEQIDQIEDQNHLVVAGAKPSENMENSAVNGQEEIKAELENDVMLKLEAEIAPLQVESQDIASQQAQTEDIVMEQGQMQDIPSQLGVLINVVIEQGLKQEVATQQVALVDDIAMEQGLTQDVAIQQVVLIEGIAVDHGQTEDVATQQVPLVEVIGMEQGLTQDSESLQMQTEDSATQEAQQVEDLVLEQGQADDHQVDIISFVELPVDVLDPEFSEIRVDDSIDQGIETRLDAAVSESSDVESMLDVILETSQINPEPDSGDRLSETNESEIVIEEMESSAQSIELPKLRQEQQPAQYQETILPDSSLSQDGAQNNSTEDDVFEALQNSSEMDIVGEQQNSPFVELASVLNIQEELVRSEENANVAMELPNEIIPVEKNSGSSVDVPNCWVESNPIVENLPPVVPVQTTTLLKQREIAASIASYEAVLRQNPNNDRAWDKLGNLYRISQRYVDAIQSYEKAVALKPNMYLYHYQLSTLLAAAGDFNAAMLEILKVVEIEPKFMFAHCAIASYLRRLGKDEEAQIHIQMVLPTIGKENEYDRACFESIRGNITEALNLLEIALEKKQTTIEWIRRDQDLDFIRNDSRYKNFEKKYLASVIEY